MYKKENNNQKISPYRQKREDLISATATARKLKEAAVCNAKSFSERMVASNRPLNWYILFQIYETKGADEFRTFVQWKNEGYTILKGSKAFVVWGQPVEFTEEQKQQMKEERKGKEEANQNTDEDEKTDYFPLCYLFSNLQVRKNETKSPQAKEPKKNNSPVPSAKIPELDF